MLITDRRNTIATARVVFALLEIFIKREVYLEFFTIIVPRHRISNEAYNTKTSKSVWLSTLYKTTSYNLNALLPDEIYRLNPLSA